MARITGARRASSTPSLTTTSRPKRAAFRCPTLESIHGMMPKKDWETINDDWAAHDLAKGNQHGDLYPADSRRPLRQVRQPRRLRAQGAAGELRSLPRHVRGPQRAALPSHHGHHHLDEQSRAAQLCLADLPLRPRTQCLRSSPSCTRRRLVHIQFNEANGEVQVINNLPEPVADAVAHVAVYNLDGSLAYEHETKLTPRPMRPRILARSIFRRIFRPFTSSSWICATPRENCSRATSTGAPRRPSRRPCCSEPVPMVTLTRKVEELADNHRRQRRCTSRCTIPRRTSP